MGWAVITAQCLETCPVFIQHLAQDLRAGQRPSWGMDSCLVSFCLHDTLPRGLLVSCHFAVAEKLRERLCKRMSDGEPGSQGLPAMVPVDSGAGLRRPLLGWGRGLCPERGQGRCRDVRLLFSRKSMEVDSGAAYELKSFPGEEN